MNNIRVNSLPGMRDSAGLSYHQFKSVVKTVSSFFECSGYELIDTPLLEKAELFVRKSGVEMSSQIYTFVDPGGIRVSLRPEFTSSVIRHFIQGTESKTLPIRWQYSGPVFRYHNNDDGTYHQFTQLGAELIGDNSIKADAEILSMAWDGLQKAGLRNYRMVIGHIGIIYDVLEQLGLPEATKLFVNNNVQRLRRTNESLTDLLAQAEESGLLNTSQIFVLGGSNIVLEPDFGREQVLEFLNNEVPRPYGSRTFDEIVDRLLKKSEEATSPKALEAGLKLVQELVHIEGSYDEAIDEAKMIIKRQGISTGVLDDFQNTLNEFGERGGDVNRLVVNFGLPSGIAYYTGIIFNISHSGDADEVTLGSGGRYDGLVKSLGGEDVPALGFAYNLDRVLDAIN